jgi:transcriptional regulator with XRE-family HTH domain
MGLDIRAVIGKRIRTLRIERGMSQVALAGLSDLSRVNLGRIEMGKAVVGITTLHRIARALDVKLVDMVRGID